MLAPRAEAYVYWPNANSSSIGRANLDGAAPNQYFIRVSGYPNRIAIDDTYIYRIANRQRAIWRMRDAMLHCPH